MSPDEGQDKDTIMDTTNDAEPPSNLADRKKIDYQDDDGAAAGTQNVQAVSKQRAPIAWTTTQKQHFTRPLRSPLWLYLKLASIRSTSHLPEPSLKLDETTLRIHLMSALSSYLGDHGAAIPVDIIKISTDGASVFVRVSHTDGVLFSAAVSSWTGKGSVVGYRLLGKSPWLGTLAGSEEEGERALFDFATD